MSRLNKLPGIDTEGQTTRRNVLVGGGYAFLGMAGLGAILGDPDDDEGDNGAEATAAGDGDDDGGDDGSSNDAGGDANGDDTGDDDGETDPAEPDYGILDEWTFSGSGDAVESGLDIEDGLVVVEASHDGESNFQVELVGPERDHLFVNEIGPYEGATADSLDFGEYDVDVTADGSWELTVQLPHVNRGYDLPVTDDGDTPVVIGPYEFDGSHTMKASHEGESNFIIEVYPEMGRHELVVNEIGEYEGESTFRMDEPAWIAIEADGNWRIEVE